MQVFLIKSESKVLMDEKIQELTQNILEKILIDNGYNPLLESLIIDGILNGICSVISFLPIIVTLYFFLSILEDSGYMTRIAFIIDKIFSI